MESFPYFPATLLGTAAIVMVQSPFVVAQVNEERLATMAKEVTVVIHGQNPGSGVLIAKEGNLYSVLTAKHVVPRQDEYEIVTVDGETHPLDYSTIEKLPDVDLAIVQFTSSRNYRVAMLGDSEQVRENAAVYIAGWPHPGRAITQRIYQITAGQISGLGTLEDGYGLVYTNITRSGMSGGAVFNDQGQVIGIHGRAEGEPIYNPDTGDTVDVKSGFNLGIPISRFFDLASAQGIDLPYVSHDFSLAQSLSHEGRIFSVTMSRDGKAIAGGDGEGKISVWNAQTGELQRTFAGHPRRTNTLAIHPQGQWLASGGDTLSTGSAPDQTLKIWDLQTGEERFSLTGDSYGVRSLAFSPDGQILASAGAEASQINLWNPQTGELLRTLSGHRDYVNALSISPDGTKVVSGSSDRTVRIWDLQTGELLQTLQGHGDRITAVVVSPYGNLVATASAEGKIKLWDLDTGTLLSTLEGQSQTIYSLAIDPYGHLLASADANGAIILWSLQTGKRLRTLEVKSSRGYGLVVFDLAFSADGQRLVSGDEAGEIKIWKL